MFIYHVCTFIISPQIYSLQSASAQGRNMEMRTIQQNVDRGGRNDKIFIPSVYPQYPACLKSNFKQRWWVIRVGPCASVSGHWELTEMNSHYGMEYVTTKRFLCILSHLLNNYGEWRVSQKGEKWSVDMGRTFVCPKVGGKRDSEKTQGPSSLPRPELGTQPFIVVTWTSQTGNGQVSSWTFWIRVSKTWSPGIGGRGPVGLLWDTSVFTHLPCW